MSMFDNLKNKVGNIYRNTVGNLKSVPIESQFIDKGTLTPEEFEIAGDQLIFVSNNWKWCKAENESLHSKKLPLDKQYLKASIISTKRIDHIFNNFIEKDIDNEEWIVSEYKDNEDKVKIENFKEDDNKLDNVFSGDMDDFDENEEVKEEDQPKNENNLLQDENKRYYEVYITYDFYYNVPRFWMTGKDKDFNQLKNEEIFEDIVSDYKNKTVTIEKYPHINISMASIHPCKHSNVIKYLVGEALKNGEKITVEQYLFIFLKFISSVMPTLEIDYTTEIKLN